VHDGGQSKRSRAHALRRVRPLEDARGQSLLGRRAKEVCVAGTGDLLMRKRKHFINKTVETGLVFPDPSPIPLSA
jgi:hypothetical protein